MLVFADSAWHVFSALIVFLAGFWVALAQKRLFSVGHNHAILFYLWHTAFCLYYFYYSLGNVADSTAYYIHSVEVAWRFGLGTRGIYALTSLFSSGLGFSYGGVFLVYNLFGFIGMLAFASALQQILSKSNRRMQYLALITVLLPGLSFWSSAIGKDALTFMGGGLAVWAALDISRRYPAIVISVLAFLLARPHMAGILLASLAVALLFAARMGGIKRVVLVVATLPAAYAGVIFGLQFAGLGDAAVLTDIEDYFEVRQGYNLGGGSSVDISGMSLPARFLTYMFRPMFLDAGGVLGLIVSVENAFLAVMIISALVMKMLGRKSTLNLFAFIFFSAFVFVSWFVLSNVTANLGIAIRQKWMFLPMLLAIAFSYMPQARRR